MLGIDERQSKERQRGCSLKLHILLSTQRWRIRWLWRSGGRKQEIVHIYFNWVANSYMCRAVWTSTRLIRQPAYGSIDDECSGNMRVKYLTNPIWLPFRLPSFGIDGCWLKRIICESHNSQIVSNTYVHIYSILYPGVVGENSE